MASSEQKLPLFAWIEAGAGLVAHQVEQTQQRIQRSVDESKELLDQLSARGELVEAQLRRNITPSSWWENGVATPVNELLQKIPLGCTANSKRQKLDELSGKVDALIEQVALLAAKRASEQKAAKAAAEKSAASKPAASSDAAEKKITRTRSTATKSTSASKSTSARSTASKPAAKRATSSRSKTTTRRSTTSKTTGAANKSSDSSES